MGKEKNTNWTGTSAVTSMPVTLPCPVLQTFQDIWLSKGQPSLLPHLQTQRVNPFPNVSTWLPPRHRVFSTSKRELTPYSLILAPGCQDAVRPGSSPTATTHSLVCALPSRGPCLGEAVPLTHPASLGNKCASPSLPRREARGNDMCRLCSPNHVSTQGGGTASLSKLLQHIETCHWTS